MKIVESIYFDIGHDMRKYGQRLSSDLDKSIANGWHTADLKFGNQYEIPDRAVLRWLQLRRSACKRGVYFDPHVTPNYLGLLGATECPIAGIRLTVGTQTDTDGSIDRVLNSYGYTPGNLVFMSVKANAAKGSLSADEIRARSEANREMDGLSAKSWKLMAYIVDVAEESLTGDRRQFLTGEPHIAGLGYALSADVQAAITSLTAVKHIGAFSTHPIVTFFRLLHDNSCRTTSKNLCLKLSMQVAKSGFIGNGHLMWSYWGNEKNAKVFNDYWGTLIDKDIVAIGNYLEEIRSAGNVINTPTKSTYREFTRQDIDSSLTSTQQNW